MPTSNNLITNVIAKAFTNINKNLNLNTKEVARRYSVIYIYLLARKKS